MKKMVKYFVPNGDSSYFDELKTWFFIRMCLIGIILIIIGGISTFYQHHHNFIVSFLSNISNLIILVSALFLLKYKGIKKAGNFFSLFSMLSLLLFTNILNNNVDITYKFVLGLYSLLGFLTFNVLFATRTVIVINSILTLLTSLHVYWFAILHQPAQKTLFTTAYIHYSLVIIAIFTIIFYTNKFIGLTIEKAERELKKKEQKNKELLASDEEIRAANEQLVSTTDALMELNEELTEAKFSAEESDRLKTDFLNNMSHEVRTPMNGIIGFTQLLMLPNLPLESKKNYVQTIQESSNKLLSIIDNIIEISKLGTNQVKVYNKTVVLNDMLDELLAINEMHITEKDLSIKLTKDLSDEESKIIIDEIKLYKVLSNLLENALKFTEHGVVEFGYRMLDKHKLSFDGRAIQFYIKDSGIGILPEKQKLIFNKFTQAESNLSRQYGGLGLGLSIAKENTELLQGIISLDSLRGVGSSFYVTVPYQPVS